MLPMLLSFLGAGVAKTGALGAFLGSNPLIAASIGAGLGRTAETGNLSEGIKAGFGSFVGGTALGAIGNALGGAGGQAAASQAAEGLAPSRVPVPLPRPTAGMSMPSIGNVFQGGMQFGQSAAGIGSTVGSTLASPQMPPKSSKPSTGPIPDLSTIRPMERTLRTPPAGYRPGYDPEFDYGMSNPYTSEYFTRRYASGGTVRKHVPGYGTIYLQAGGIADLVAEPEDGVEIEPEDGGFEIEESRTAGGNEKSVIVDAVMAIKNMHPQPEVALATFVQNYGEESLRDLVDRVQSGEFDETIDRFSRGEKGEVRGPGDGSGTDDMVPATIDGQQDVLLSDGEFVVRKDSTDALEDEFGSGFMDRMNGAGPKAPEVVREMVMS